MSDAKFDAVAENVTNAIAVASTGVALLACHIAVVAAERDALLERARPLAQIVEALKGDLSARIGQLAAMTLERDALIARVTDLEAALTGLLAVAELDVPALDGNTLYMIENAGAVLGATPAKPAACLTCNGHGLIGGFQGGGAPGYVSEDCPDCGPDAKATPATGYAPLTDAEIEDLSAMVWGAPACSAWLKSWTPFLRQYEELRASGKRPVDPAKTGGPL